MKAICPPGCHYNRFARLVQHSLVHWYYRKAIAAIIGRPHCFHDYIYIMPILFL